MEESNSATSGGSVRFPGLDGLHTLAVTSVFLFHFGLVSPEFREHALRQIYHLDTGVQIFFVLSGFLIYRPFAVAHLSGRPAPDVRGYGVRRFLRIFPAYWVALAVLFALGTIEFPFGRVWSYVTLTQTYASVPWERLGGISVAWSLVVEVSFYVFVPLWALAVRVIARGRRAFAIEIAGAGALIVYGVFSLWWSAYGDPPRLLEVLPTALATLGGGMLLAVLTARAQDLPRLTARLARIGAPAGWWWLAAVCIYLFQSSFTGPPGPDQYFREQVLRIPVAMLLVAPAVLAPAAGGWVRRLLAWRPVVFIGTISYGMYLWHTFVGREVYGHTWIPRDVNIVLAYGITIAIASASWYLLERPVMRLAHRRRAPVG